VRLIRAIGGDEAAETADAAFFSSLTFVPGSPSTPVAPGDIRDPGDGSVAVVEAPAEAAASIEPSKVVLVSRGSAPGAPPEGVAPVATVVTAVDGPEGASFEAAEGAPPVISISEDRVLAGFSVAEAQAALRAETLVEGDDTDTTCDYLVIAPIGSDAGQPYFRRFHTQAVVVRFDKTDMHLAAMQADPACLILTGGRRPSEYLFDAASARGVPVLLSRTDTENTVIALEGIFDRTRFGGERKTDRIAELLAGTPLYDAIGG
jgi:hypothetical protein